MLSKHRLALGDHPLQQLGIRATSGQILANRFTRHIMRRRRLQTRPVAAVTARVAAVHHDVAVTHARIQRHVRQLRMLRKVRQQLPSLLVGNMTRRVVLHVSVNHRHQVDPKDPVGVFQINSKRSGLQRRPPGVIFNRVITQKRHRTNIRPARHAHRRRRRRPLPTTLGQRINMRLLRRLEGCPPIKLIQRKIRPTIRYHNHVFHRKDSTHDRTNRLTRDTKCPSP